MMSNMRSIAAPFIAAPPTGARIRARLRVEETDAQVLRLVGEHLGSLAGLDLAIRCQLGNGNANANGDGSVDDRRAERKQALTAASSSPWAGSITRTANDQWQRQQDNLLDAQAGLRRAVTVIRARLGVPVGTVEGRGRGRSRSRVRGYGSQAERFEKQRRLHKLAAKLQKVDARLEAGQVSVCRGGRQLFKLRHSVDREDGTLTAPRLTAARWQARWQAARLFLTADGEASKPWGNETIRVHPDQGWLELRLPTPLASVSNTPGRAAT